MPKSKIILPGALRPPLLPASATPALDVRPVEAQGQHVVMISGTAFGDRGFALGPKIALQMAAGIKRAAEHIVYEKWTPEKRKAEGYPEREEEAAGDDGDGPAEDLAGAAAGAEPGDAGAAADTRGRTAGDTPTYDTDRPTQFKDPMS